MPLLQSPSSHAGATRAAVGTTSIVFCFSCLEGFVKSVFVFLWLLLKCFGGFVKAFLVRFSGLCVDGFGMLNLVPAVAVSISGMWFPGQCLSAPRAL